MLRINLLVTSLITLVTAVASAAEPNKLTPEEIADGWILLFDGETTFGWRQESKADWKIEGGVISVSSGEKGLLRTSMQWSDYVLKVDFRADAKTNSGIFLRTPPKPTDPQADCYELNIAPPDNPFPTASLVGRQKATGKHDSADWQTFEVTLTGGEVKVKLNGAEALSYTDPNPLGRGFIGLQLNEGKCEFRNIKLKPLGLAPLFNGKDLTGLKQPANCPTKATATPAGELRLVGGKGYVETEKLYGDFVCQLEYLIPKPGLNSGLFFRCIPSEEMNGYESQIHNGFKGGNRAEPVDCGTGGIFRRVNARKVVGDDGRWVAKTIAAEGASICVWVDGYQVTDWNDQREPHANPRNGRRLEAGTIQLQGHDPGTDISFRNLRAVELTKRWGQ